MKTLAYVKFLGSSRSGVGDLSSNAPAQASGTHSNLGSNSVSLAKTPGVRRPPSRLFTA